MTTEKRCERLAKREAEMRQRIESRRKAELSRKAVECRLASQARSAMLKTERLAERESAMRQRIELRRYLGSDFCYRCEQKSAVIVSVDENGRKVLRCKRPDCLHRFRSDPKSFGRERMKPVKDRHGGWNEFGMRPDIYVVYRADLKQKSKKRCR